MYGIFFLSADDARNVGSRDCEEGIMVVEPTNQPTNQPTGREREANNDDAATKQMEGKGEREGEEKKGSRGRVGILKQL